MWDTIRELVRDGCTVLLTTQYLDEGDQLAGRVPVTDRGPQAAEGTPDEVNSTGAGAPPAELRSSVGSSALQLRMADAAETPGAADIVRRVLREEPVLTPE